jgi:type II pantothenate kinase
VLRLYESKIEMSGGLPAGATGIDAGLTLTKVVSATEAGELDAYAFETASSDAEVAVGEDAPTGVTGARADAYTSIEGATSWQEIEAAARGARSLAGEQGDFVLALLGTGTAFAAVRGDRATHLGGTPLGGGSFAGIAGRLAPEMTYEAWIAAAARGDRTRADLMVADAYPQGIGRIGGAMTAAHLAKADVSSGGDASLDDVLAALLNLHGENIAQIAASRAIIAQIPRLLLAGGFAHENHALVESLTSMAQLFGVQTVLAPHPGFAGALGAAMLAAEAR